MLIAEIGNNHFGDMKTAKELIRVAALCGADLIKSQAFKAKDISGSMPFSFYQMCELPYEGYVELIEYSRSMKVEMFYSIFSKELRDLEQHQNWYKVAGSQSRSKDTNWVKEDDSSTFVSIPKDITPPPLDNAQVLYVCDYLAQDPELDHITMLAEFYERPCGYSDHTIGIEACKTALTAHDANVIEKHFGLKKNMAYKGKIFRDTVHCADAFEFEKLATIMKGKGVAS